MIIAIFSLIILAIFIRVWSYKNTKIEKGVTKEYAENKVDEDSEKYFILKPELWTTSRGWIIESSNTQNLLELDVELVGNTPKEKIKSMVLLNEENSFFIEGELIKEKNVISVKKWYFITPIIRDYLHPVNSKKSRLFYPKKFVDQFDVDNNDYLP